MNNADAIAALIEDLKAVTAARAKLFDRGEWTREEMERANGRIAEVQRQIAALKG